MGFFLLQMQQKLFFILIVTLFSAVTYANSFTNDFVWDDKKFIQENIGIRSLNNIPVFFFDTTDGLYRPLRTTLYAFTYSVWGDNKFGYHLNSLLWHTLNSILVLLILTRLTSHKFIPVVAASIFAVHPIHTERVTNMTGGFDLLGIALILLSFYLYILYRQNQKKGYLIVSVMSFIAALFSSEEAFILPPLLLLYEIVFNNLTFDFEKHKKQIYRLASFFAVTAIFVYFRFIVIGLGARTNEYVTGSFFTTFLTMIKIVFYYFYLIFIPYPLTLYREIKTSTSLFDPMVIFSLLVILAVSFIAIKYYKRNKLLAFSIGWFFITFLPFSNILPLQTLMADRYLYLPSVSSAILFSYFFFKIPKKKTVSLLLSVAVITSFLFITIDRNADWKNDLTLWEETSKTSSKTSVVWSNLGFAYEQNNRLVDSKSALSTAVSLDPLNEKAHYNLGIVYMKQKNYGKATDAFISAINNNPSYVKAYDSLGLTYYYASLEIPEQRDFFSDQAKQSFEKAIIVEPRYYKSYSDLGIVYAQQGNLTVAISLFERSIQLNPWNHEAYYNLGIIYEALEETTKARQNFLTASSLQPENNVYTQKVKQYS
ncbi:hypothetical protein CMO88_05020 [Candidatus Woesearchaeota archaeon]|nr:hypothetical protein [Candidatus Woesearchaeota archaeon]|tara:strand:- start:2590 stop:4380 length:1791 start_codon:yes stop_codon:yes gene_type:complete